MCDNIGIELKVFKVQQFILKKIHNTWAIHDIIPNK